MESLALRIPPALQVVILGMAMLLLSRGFPHFQIFIPGSILLAASLVVIGVGAIFLGVVEFRKAQTTIDPRKPECSVRLVISGIYQYSRNPMYVGFALLLLAVAFYLSHVFAFCLVPLYIAYMNRFQIQPEEKFMRQKFTSDYQIYLEQVRRWI